MEQKIDLIIDFETFGTDASKCAPINMAAFKFDWSRFLVSPYTFEELLNDAEQYKFRVDSLLKIGFETERATVDWWKSLPSDIRSQAVPKDDDLLLEEFCDSFISYLGTDNIQHWWSRSNTYDPTILYRLFRKNDGHYYRMNSHLPHWKVRDARTWIDAKFDFADKNGFVPVADENYWNETFKEHNSIHDIAADVMRLQTICRAENDLKQTER